MRYEIRDIRMPARVQEAMQMQVCNMKSQVQDFRSHLDTRHFYSAYVLSIPYRLKLSVKNERPFLSLKVSSRPR